MAVQVSKKFKSWSEEERERFKEVTKLYGKSSGKYVSDYLNKTKADVNEVFKVGSNSMNPFSWTGLICACRNLNLEVMDELLKRGANPNLTTGGLSPLMTIAMASCQENGAVSIACAEMLIKAGASIRRNPIFNNCTLLTRAIRNEAGDFVKFLVDHGADVNQRDAHGETPLNVAIFTLQKDVAQTLINHGANPFINNLDNVTSMELAEQKSKEDDKIELLVGEWRLDYYEKNFRKKRVKFHGMLRRVNPTAPRIASKGTDGERAKDERKEIPTQEGKPAPKQEVKRIRKQEETPIPRHEGKPIPKKEGNPIPKQEGSLIPKQVGKPIPKQEGNPIPKQEGSLIPKQVGKPIPKQVEKPIREQKEKPIPRQEEKPIHKQEEMSISTQEVTLVPKGLPRTRKQWEERRAALTSLAKKGPVTMTSLPKTESVTSSCNVTTSAIERMKVEIANEEPKVIRRPSPPRVVELETPSSSPEASGSNADFDFSSLPSSSGTSVKSSSEKPGNEVSDKITNWEAYWFPLALVVANISALYYLKKH